MPRRCSAPRKSPRQAEELIMKVPGVKYTTTVVGYSMLSQVTNTYSAFFFITLEDWAARKKPEEQYAAIKAELSREARRNQRRRRFLVSAAGDSRRRRLGRGDLHSRRPRRQGHRLPRRKHHQVHRSREKASRTGERIDDLPADRAAALHRGRPGQGAQAGCRHQRCVQDAAELPRQRLHQLLQPLRAAVAGICPGRG